MRTPMNQSHYAKQQISAPPVTACVNIYRQTILYLFGDGSKPRPITG